jgi:hypothetical protein
MVLVHLQQLADEMIYQQRNIVSALAKCRQFDPEHIQPVKEIGPKATLLDGLLEVPVRGGHTAEVDLNWLVTTHPNDLTFLQHAEKVRLSLQADIADLIQEDRSSLGDLELPFLAVLGAGEGSFFVTEQLAFQQSFRQCAAVNYHQRMKLSGARMMDRPCN